MKQNKNTRLAALFILLAALLLAAGCSRSGPESAGTAGPTQASAVATDAGAQPGDATAGTASPESATPTPDAPAATDGTSAAGSASPDGTMAAGNGAAGSSGGATGSASATSGGSGTGGTENAAAPSADAAVSSPSASTPKPSLATPKPASGTGASPATDKPSATAHVSPTPSPAPTQSPHKDEVTLSVVGDSDTGTILAPAAVELKKGDSVLDVLKRATRSRKMQMEYSGGGAASYVEGIDNLYEFDKGAKSGWLFRVNGEFPGVSAGAYKLKAGDTVEWLYTLDMGKDVGKDADDKENAS